MSATEMSAQPRFSDENLEAGIRRLKAIEGQARGLQRMLEEGRYCVDILTQISATQEGLRQVAKIVMRNYLENCATRGIQSGDPEARKATYDDIMDVFFKFNR